MNTELIGRMMEARKYQMLAIKALFPEEKQEHIDNIERELKAMFSESVMEILMKCMNTVNDVKSQVNREECESNKCKTEHTVKKEHVSKVTIE